MTFLVMKQRYLPKMNKNRCKTNVRGPKHAVRDPENGLLSTENGVQPRSGENRVWFANRDKAQKRVRKSGGRAHGRDSETSEQAHYAISPSAQLVTSKSQGRTIYNITQHALSTCMLLNFN
ncbi:hypothetical protein CsSME_00017228 [Camellia sinensis var. sinensis]